MELSKVGNQLGSRRTMTFRLITLFLITTFVGTLASVIQQQRYIANFQSRYSVMVPVAQANEVLVTTVSLEHAIVVVGQFARARMRLVKSATADCPEILAEEMLPPGYHTVFLGEVFVPIPTNIGFACQGKSHFVSNASRIGGYTFRGTTSVDQSMVLTRTRTCTNEVSYHVLIDAVN